MLTRMPPPVVRTMGVDSRCTGHALLSVMGGAMWSFPVDVLAERSRESRLQTSRMISFSTDLSLFPLNSSACSSDSASSILSSIVSASWLPQGSGCRASAASLEQCLPVHGVQAVWQSFAQGFISPSVVVVTIHMRQALQIKLGAEMQ